MNDRFEEKYLITDYQYTILKQRLKVILSRDTHTDEKNDYHIRSIYFDDYVKTGLRQKEEGLKDRYKYRIRFYNLNQNTIKIEKKVKTNQVGHKESMPLTKLEAEHLLQNDYSFLESKDSKLAKELFYLFRSRLLKPVIMIDYIREPYVYPIQNVRITFDKAITYTSHTTFGFSTEQKMTSPTKYIILEIKYHSFLPKLIQDLLKMNLYKTSLSKYLLCVNHANGEELI